VGFRVPTARTVGIAAGAEDALVRIAKELAVLEG